MTSILEARDLQKVFEAGEETVHALRGVSLTVESGEFVTVIGPSGSGKSTLLQLLGGLDWPTNGSTSIAGVALTGLSEQALTRVRREKTGFVFQHFNLLPALNVYENVALPFLINGRVTATNQERIEDMLQLFGLKGRERRPVTQLSAGEQQRVAIARAFVTEPAIVLADDPTGNLDIQTATEIIQLLWESCDNLGQTILVVTHDPKVAAFADRVLFLNEGELVDELALGRREEHADAGPIFRRLEDLSL